MGEFCPVGRTFVQLGDVGVRPGALERPAVSALDFHRVPNHYLIVRSAWTGSPSHVGGDGFSVAEFLGMSGMVPKREEDNGRSLSQL